MAVRAEEGVPPDPKPDPKQPPTSHQQTLSRHPRDDKTLPGAGSATSTALLLPLGADEFPDEVLAIVCRFLGLRDLGRLACVSRRFSERTLTEKGGESGDGAMLSAIEEGARLQVLASSKCCRGAARHGQATWMRALWYLKHRIVVQQFETLHGDIHVTEAGAVVTVPDSSCHGGYLVCSNIRTEAGGLMKWSLKLVEERRGGFLMGVFPCDQAAGPSVYDGQRSASDWYSSSMFVKAEPPIDRSGYWGQDVHHWAMEDFKTGPVTLALDLQAQMLSWTSAVGVTKSVKLPQPPEGIEAYDWRPCVALSHGATVQSCPRPN